MDREHWNDELRRRAETEFPHVMKVGRYIFFAWLAFGAALTIATFLHIIGVPKDFSGDLIAPASFIVFLLLRDMARLWDMARFAARIEPEKQP